MCKNVVLKTRFMHTTMFNIISGPRSVNLVALRLSNEEHCGIGMRSFQQLAMPILWKSKLTRNASEGQLPDRQTDLSWAGLGQTIDIFACINLNQFQYLANLFSSQSHPKSIPFQANLDQGRSRQIPAKPHRRSTNRILVNHSPELHKEYIHFKKNLKSQQRKW
uniref:Uncharacterized protein n=1 Tax=Glossina palpalis gambiensis TaxID=67801 RepID=A0A1B0BJ87_9MUSC